VLVGDRLFQEYDGVQIIRDVTISVGSGAVTVLIGKSGSGKSTLLRTLSILDPPRAGTVSLGSRRIFPRSDVSSGAHWEWPGITLVFQQFFLWPHITVRQNVLLPARLRGKPVDQAESLCRSLAIDDLLERYPNQISVGQRQRAALARALLLNPQFLLLDEITSAQDVQHISLILEVLQGAVRNGMGLLVVSHHFGFVRRLLSTSPASQVVFLNAGSVVEAGGVEHLDSPTSGGLREYVTLSRALD
jgi:arginine transport system ATP-binding protein